ncbi:TBC1 domain family member 12 [Platysternon megacephalum]|uniref:TBC1 domain family member 12 n=1 Tax=Platysternon megacephalum TaxID=55544 RepID=A0A4D9EIC3_9SAUR|nr:TBC1 domain family member 12 [Platysternon megacephalum]
MAVLGSTEEPQYKRAASALDFLQTSTLVPLITALFLPPELGGRDVPWALDCEGGTERHWRCSGWGLCPVPGTLPPPPTSVPISQAPGFPRPGDLAWLQPGEVPFTPVTSRALREGRGWISLARGPHPKVDSSGSSTSWESPSSGFSPDPSSSQEAPGMDWLRGLEWGCQPGPEETPLWMESCWEIHLWRLP